jgi:hypothetical protein
MVKMPLYQVVGMIAVRYRLMATSSAVFVPSGVAPAIVVSPARCRVPGVDRNHMFFNMIALAVVQMPIMKVVSVSLVADSGVSAARAVLVRVLFVNTT